MIPVKNTTTAASSGNNAEENNAIESHIVDPDDLLAVVGNMVVNKEEADKEKSFENPFNQGNEILAAE